MEALQPMQSNVKLQLTPIMDPRSPTDATYLVHGYPSDPPILLEDFLHVSLHYLERVEVPNKNPKSGE